MDEIEAKYPDSTAIYADACGGNQYTFAADGSEPLAACKARGHELAEVVLRIGNGSLEEVTGPIESRLKVLDLPLAEPVSYKRALELAQGVPLDAGFKAFPDPRRDTNWIRALLKHYKEGIPFPTRISEYVCTDEEFLVKELDEPRKYPCRFEEVLGARIGKLTLLAIQGEPLAQIGMRIKEALRQRGPAMVFGYFARTQFVHPDARECAARFVPGAVAARSVHLSGRLVSGCRRGDGQRRAGGGGGRNEHRPPKTEVLPVAARFGVTPAGPSDSPFEGAAAAG